MSNSNSDQTAVSEESLHFVISEKEFPEDDRVIADINGRQIAVFNLEDEYYALSNFCTHQGGPVCEGMVSGTLSINEEQELIYCLEDELVACPWHGWEFHIKDGKHTATDDYRIPSYDVVVQDGDIFVQL